MIFESNLVKRGEKRERQEDKRAIEGERGMEHISCVRSIAGLRLTPPALSFCAHDPAHAACTLADRPGGGDLKLASVVSMSFWMMQAGGMAMYAFMLLVVGF
jgi:hypothetical protein